MGFPFATSPRRNRVGSVIAFLLVFLLPALSRAGVNQWSNIGPYAPGGVVRAIAADIAAPGTLYAATDGGIFKSLDAGTSWGAVNAGLTGFTVYTLASDPSTSGTLYAGTNAGVFKTTNGGNAWFAQTTGLTGASVRSLAIDPVNPRQIYAGTLSNGVFLSSDGGGSWAAMNAGLSSGDVRSVVIDPSTPSTVYAGTSAGVSRSIDSAATWSTVFTVGGAIRVLAIDPSSPATIYAGTDGAIAGSGVFKSTNGGTSWANASAGLGGLSVLSISVDPQMAAHVFASTQGAGIFATQDGGSSWQLLSGSPQTIGVVVADPVGSNVYAGGSNGFFRSPDQGLHWNSQFVAFTTLTVNAILADPSSQPTTLYAGVTSPGVPGGGVYKTRNSGATWSASGSGLPNVAVQVLGSGTGSNPPLLAGTAGSGVYRSADEGASWVAVNSGLGSQNIHALGWGGGRVYVGTNSGLYWSDDNGGTWTAGGAALSSLTIFALAVDGSAPLTVYAGTQNGVYKSTDGGVTFDSSSVGLPASFSIVTLAVDPTTTATIYAGTFSNGGGVGVYRSDDGGANWSAMNGGIESLAVTALTTDPAGAFVFAGTPVGVFRAARGGTSWTPVSNGLTEQVVTSLAVDPRSPSTVYAGTLGNSVFESVFSAALGSCSGGPSTLCLNGNRFRVEVDWRAENNGTSGTGMAVPLASDTGAFWFFSSGNVELVIKVVDGRTLNGSFWVFYGALSDVSYTITVTDTVTGAMKVYENAQGQLASVADTSAFPQSLNTSAESLFQRPSSSVGVGSPGLAASVPEVRTGFSTDAATGNCVADATSLCLNGNRFRVRVTWFAIHSNAGGDGQALPLTGDSGSFWFFSSGNLELNIKVVDGRAVNSHFWAFYGALSDVQYTITVTDTQTGAQRVYFNPQGRLASVADTSAF